MFTVHKTGSPSRKAEPEPSMVPALLLKSMIYKHWDTVYTGLLSITSIEYITHIIASNPDQAFKLYGLFVQSLIATATLAKLGWNWWKETGDRKKRY